MQDKRACLRSAALLIASIMSVFYRPSFAQPKVVEFHISAQALACLRLNARIYRSAPRNPLFIPLRQCPSLPTTPVLGSLVNEGPQPGRSADEGDTFIYITKAQFECLIKARPKKARNYRFLPQSCELGPLK